MLPAYHPETGYLRSQTDEAWPVYKKDEKNLYSCFSLYNDDDDNFAACFFLNDTPIKN